MSENYQPQGQQKPDAQPTAYQPQNYQPQQPAPKSNKVILIIVIALAIALILAVGALVYVVINNNQGGDTINNNSRGGDTFINHSTTSSKKEPGPESALERLKNGMASMNIEMIADSFAPEYSGPLKSLVSLGSSFAGIDINDMVGVMPLIGMMSGVDSQSYMPSVSYTIHEKEVRGDTARMYVTLVIRSAYETETMEGWFGARKIDGAWYLTDGGY